MQAWVNKASTVHSGARILGIHGADHNYWYKRALGATNDIELVYALQ